MSSLGLGRVWGAGVIVSSLWACNAQSNAADDGVSHAGTGGGAGHGGAQSEAGRGGSIPSVGGDASSGDSGTAGGPDTGERGGAGGVPDSGGASAGAAGAGGSFTYDEDLCDCTLDVEGHAMCTIAPDEFEKRAPVPNTCDSDVLWLEERQCDDGTTRVTWSTDVDEGFIVVTDTESSDPIYGRADSYLDFCDVGNRLEAAGYGTAPPESEDCELTRYCCNDQDVCDSAGGFTYDYDLCNCKLNQNGDANCTTSQDDFLARVTIPNGCDPNRDVDEFETLACDDGTTRVRWIEGAEQDYSIVSDTASGEFVYGRTSPYQNFCDTGGRFEDTTFGTAPSEPASCERSQYCCANDFCGDEGTAGAGGEAGRAR